MIFNMTDDMSSELCLQWFEIGRHPKWLFENGNSFNVTLLQVCEFWRMSDIQLESFHKFVV